MSASALPRKVRVSRTLGDRVFRRMASGAGGLAFVIMGLIGLFLFVRAVPALREAKFGFLSELVWRPDVSNPVFGIAAVMFGTFVIAFIALALAVCCQAVVLCGASDLSRAAHRG